MGIAARVQDDVVRNEVALANSSEAYFVPCDFSRCWDLNERITDQTLLRFVRNSDGRYRILYPTLLAATDLSFVEVIATAELRKRVSQLGSLIRLRDTDSGEFETYLISDSSSCPTESPDIVATGWGSPLGKQIKGRRIGERFSVTLPKVNIEFEVVSLELSE